MNKKDILIAVLVLVLLFVLGYVFISGVDSDPEQEQQEEIISEEQPSEQDEEDDDQVEEDLKEIILGYLGYPHASDPLDEDDNLYNNRAFNSTTLVLVSTVDYHFPEDSEEGMRQIHYYPAGEVSYENRLHFSTYRNKVSDYFSDITVEVGGDLVNSKIVTLNKEREDGRLLDIDWEEEIELHYVDVDEVMDVIPELPEVAGITFIVDGDEDIGLDVRREGLLVDGDRLIHAPANREEVVEDNLIDFLEDEDYDGVNFFKINE